MLVLARN